MPALRKVVASKRSSSRRCVRGNQKATASVTNVDTNRLTPTARAKRPQPVNASK